MKGGMRRLCVPAAWSMGLALAAAFRMIEFAARTKIRPTVYTAPENAQLQVCKQAFGAYNPHVGIVW